MGGRRGHNGPGRHGWQGGRGPQRGQIARLLEPCLLMLLQEGPSHGYDLIAALARFGFEPDMLDSGLVYRALRNMEAIGWVTSDWAMGSAGPPRRMYTLTSAGQEALGTWKEELAKTHDILHTLLQDAEDETGHN